MLDTRKLVPSVSTKGHPRSIPSLDGLRAIAVLGVLAAHCGIPQFVAWKLASYHLGLASRLIDVDWGDLGVSTFFVISGFLITTLLVKKSALPSLSDFYTRRFFRIFPPYYVYLAVIGILWLAGWVPMLRGAFISSVLYLSNYFPYTVSEPAGRGWLVGHTWSLSLEEQFYLFWPFVLLRFGRQKALWVAVSILLLSPFLRILTLRMAPWTVDHFQIDRMFHTRMDTIITGCVLALMEDSPKAYKAMEWAVRQPWLATVGLIALWVVQVEDGIHFGLMQAAGMSAEAVLLGYLIFYAVQNGSGWSGRLLNLAPLRHIGMISYSLYLWQQLFTGATRVPVRHRWMAVVLTFCCAETSYYLVEMPSLRLRDRYLALRRGRPQAANRQSVVQRVEL